MTNRRFQFRSALLWLHRWLGLVSGVVVFIVSITGCLYVFEEELRPLVYADYLLVKPQPAPKQSVVQLYQAVRQMYPDEQITQIRLKNDPVNSAAIVYTKSDRHISVNPYTAQPFAVRKRHDDLFALAQDIHMTLLLGESGEQVVKWNVLIFTLILLSGLWVWWPKQWRFLRAALTIKWGASFKRVTYDLHAVSGFYAVLILLAIAWSGLYWTFDSAKAITYWLTNGQKPKTEKFDLHPVAGRPALPVPQLLNAAMREAHKLGPYRQAFVQFPKDEKAPFWLVLRYPYQWIRSQNVLQFDPFTGRLLNVDLARNYTTSDKIRMSNYDVHTGRLLGMTSKILWFLASLFAASLPVTGFLIWWNRRKPKKTGKTGRQLNAARPQCRTFPTSARVG